MLARQKVLLSLILALNKAKKPATKTYLDKLLFILKQEYSFGEQVKFYNFYPHKFGPFSNNYYADLATLESHGFIDGRQIPSERAMSDSKFDASINDAISRFPNPEKLVEYVYGKYPEYAIKSVLKTKSLGKMPPKIFSIGYEKKDIDSFLDLLIRNYVDVVVDVRANPFSMNFAFTKNKLEKSLENAEISYLHFPKLGIDGSMRKKLETRSDYDELFVHYANSILPPNMAEVEKVVELSHHKRIALLCFEQDHDYCHRGVLGKKLEEITGQKVEHL